MLSTNAMLAIAEAELQLVVHHSHNMPSVDSLKGKGKSCKKPTTPRIPRSRASWLLIVMLTYIDAAAWQSSVVHGNWRADSSDGEMFGMTLYVEQLSD